MNTRALISLIHFDVLMVFLQATRLKSFADLCNITVNKNAVFGDSSALAPGGVRIGKKYHKEIVLPFLRK